MRLVARKNLPLVLKYTFKLAKYIDKSYFYPSLKRGFDFIFALMAIIVSSPIMIIAAISIKLKSPNAPILFKQKRIGLNNEMFDIYKFRTMVPDAQQKLEELMQKDPDAKDEFDKYKKLKNDPRIIPVIGNFLRETSLDEIPQFFNILFGNMSVVGPRPCVENEFDRLEDQIAVTKAKPGLTGLWQTLPNRHEMPFHERVEVERSYVRNKNMLMDIKIVFKTIGVVLGKKGM